MAINLRNFRDDRGRTRRLLSLLILNQLHLGSPLPRSVRQRLGGRITDFNRNGARNTSWHGGLLELWGGRWLLGVTLALIGVAIASPVMILVLDGMDVRWWDDVRRGYWPTLYMFGLIVGFVVLLFILSIPTDYNAKVAAMIAEEGYCPACAYSLAGQRVQEDGCTVCSECGCAMRIEAQPQEPIK